ncbi:unnamed protein product, partial [Allacma fusca]
ILTAVILRNHSSNVHKQPQNSWKYAITEDKVDTTKY